MPDSVLEMALTAISRYNMLPREARVIAAVSGGADSVCLLHVLLESAPRAGFRVAGVAHLNHKLRAAESDGDEEFVRGLAERAGVEFFRESADVAALGGNLEANARRARLDFFGRLVREHGVRVATGHTRDDQAETVLFRLMRGSGLAGLAGILPVTREGLVRPLLGVSREEIEEFLRARGAAWREDATNADISFSRNRIRKVLLPELAREWNPEIGRALARLADTALEEERVWAVRVKRLAARLIEESGSGIEMGAGQLARLPRAAGRRLVRYAVSRWGKTAEFEAVERVLALAAEVEGDGALDLGGVRVVRSFDRLRFMTAGSPVPAERVAVTAPGRYEWGGRRVCLGIGPFDPQPGGCVRLKLSGGTRSAPLFLRGWSAGDHYHPAGNFRDEKLKEMFQRARVPSWRRGSWPILCQGTEILWTRQFGAAAEWAAGPSGEALYVWEEPAEENNLKA